MSDTSIKTKREFKVLDDRTHVLHRPSMYVGGMHPVTQNQWLVNKDTQKLEYKSIEVSPALIKICSEIIDNCIDVAIDTNFKAANKIQVKVDDKSITVIDNGIGIPVKKLDDKSDDRTLPEIAWTTLRSGTSFGDNREKIGTNGLGSCAVNIFSKVFIATSDDGKKQQTITCKDNMSIIKASKIKASSGKSGVEVYFEPDLERFGLNEIDQTHKDLIYQRLFNLAISFPKIKFSYNEKQISISEKKLANMFSDNTIIDSSENTTVCVFPNEYDEFKFYAQLNGLNTFLGGSHIDYVANEITTRIRNKLVKKYKSLRPGDIKNKIGLAVIMTGFKNPEFNSQSKEELKNAWSDIGKHIDGKIDFDVFTKKILKTEAIINPIVETFKIKEELKARQELKKVKKIKVKSDKYMAPIGEQKYLALVEGNSAASGLQASLGRDGIGYFACRGLPINAYSQSIQKIVQNEEFKTIMSILNLDVSNKESEKTISFDKILIATDSDNDGSHLTSMFLGWFKRFGENLFYENKLCKLNIPLVLVIDKNEKVVEHFFNLVDFNTWEKNNSKHKYHIEYWKGLGSISKIYLNQLLDKYGLDYFIETYKLDDEGKIYLDHWLNDKTIDKRKEYLKQYNLDINNI